MTTITKERLLTIKQWRETYGPGSNVVLPAEEAEELARIALASLEAEAVMFCISGQNVDSEEHVSTSKAVVDAWVEEWNQVDGSPGEPLYKTMPLYYHAALPAPVVPDEMYWQDAPVEGSSKAAAYATGWNACRAAMLHSAEPASNHEELPLDYLQGQKDGLEWAAQLAEANHPQTGDWLYDDPLELAKAIRKGPDMPEFDGPTPITPEAIENAIEYIRSIAFHIDEDDYHGKHIAYFMRQALVWLEGHSCSDDRQGKAENQPVRGNQAAESNRGNEWTGNPDIDNAIIMLDRIDTLESCDDDRIEAVKTVLRRLAGNYPVTPDGWISCSERMPPQDDWILIYSKHGEYMAGQVQGEYVELSDGTLSWLGNALFWMPLPERRRR